MAFSITAEEVTEWKYNYFILRNVSIFNLYILQIKKESWFDSKFCQKQIDIWISVS